MAEHGRIDCAIANAGQVPMAVSTFELEGRAWHVMIDIALHGGFWTLREAARHRVARAEAGDPGGSLVYCGSLMLFQGVPDKGNYSAAKAGMGAVVRLLAVEFGKHGIGANTIAPGNIKTGMTGDSAEWSEYDRFFAGRTPIPRPGLPADFEAIAAYLCSDGSSFHTGDTIVIDGGSLVTPPYADF